MYGRSKQLHAQTRTGTLLQDGEHHAQFRLAKLDEIKLICTNQEGYSIFCHMPQPSYLSVHLIWQLQQRSVFTADTSILHV